MIRSILFESLDGLICPVSQQKRNIVGMFLPAWSRSSRFSLSGPSNSRPPTIPSDAGTKVVNYGSGLRTLVEHDPPLPVRVFPPDRIEAADLLTGG